MAFELEHDQTHGYYFSNLIPGVISGGVAFAIVYPLIGAPFLGGVPVPRVEFESWMLAAAVGLGLLGAMAALVVGKVMVTVVGWMRRLDDAPVMRGVLGGAVVAAIGFALPLTMFSGQEGLETIVEEPASFSILLLITLALLKTVALSASLGGGFYGGPIFPMFFIGGSLGVATHLALPEVPLGLALACLMAALGSAVAMLPLSMSVFAAVLVSADFLTFGAIAIAAATGYAVRHLVMSTQGSDLRTAAAENPD
jgi:H+/Cl- antiporter ClcA